MKLEIRNLHTRTEHLNKENIDLKSKANITNLSKSTLKPVEHQKLNENIQERNEAIKNVNL